jgi:hypothetical protein
MSSSEKSPSLAADIIWGVSGEHGIAAEIGVTPAKAYHLIELGVIPVLRHGHRTISASRSELRRRFTSRTSDTD